MKHKWMTLLVVIVTTLTTAQEAFKQYDSLKAQSEGWATLRLWTGLLSAYAPQEEEGTLAAPPVIACSADQLKGEEARSRESATTPAGTILIQYSDSHKRAETVSFAPPVLASALDVEHHNDAAGTEALERIREVALLIERDDEPEAAAEPAPEDAETGQVSAPDDETEQGAALRVLSEVRFISHAARLVEAEAASPPSDADSGGAATDNARTATRVKAKAIRRALKAMQFQFDRAAKAGLRTGLRAVKVESPKVMETVSLAVKDSGLIATIYPAPQVDALSPLNSVGVGGSSGGGCASE